MTKLDQAQAKRDRKAARSEGFSTPGHSGHDHDSWRRERAQRQAIARARSQWLDELIAARKKVGK